MHPGLLHVDGVGAGQMFAVSTEQFVLQLALGAVTAQLEFAQVIVGHVGGHLRPGRPDLGHAAHEPKRAQGQQQGLARGIGQGLAPEHQQHGEQGQLQQGEA